MVGDVAVRCGARSVALVEIDGDGTILSAKSYNMEIGDGADITSEAWLLAFAKIVPQIPRRIRKRITLVTPPNREIFVKHLHIPEVTEKNVREAFRFECEHEFPGGSEAWCLDIYQTKNQTKYAVGLAISRAFSERFIDILIRNGIQISHICPEILLNTVAIQNCADSPADSILMHIGEGASYLSCIGKDGEYFRTLPIAGSHLSKTISESQKISLSEADKLQLEFLENPESENRAFMTYYAKQFIQKLHQELKRSELFYCRTFKQAPAAKLYLTGYRKKLYKFFAAKDSDQTLEIIDMFDILKGNVAPGVKEEELEIVKRNVGTFVGAAHCLKKKKGNLLNLFSADFLTQVEFQRQHFGYMLALIAATLLALTWMKALGKDVMDLRSKKGELEAKLLETNIDTVRYEELVAERENDRAFIANMKFAVYSQYAWADLFNEIQSRVEILRTAWIETLEWIDRTSGDGNDRIRIAAKMLTVDDEAKRSANELIEDFIESMGKIDSLESVENVAMSRQDENTLTFSFDVKLKQQCEFLAK